MKKELLRFWHSRYLWQNKEMIQTKKMQQCLHALGKCKINREKKEIAQTKLNTGKFLDKGTKFFLENIKS